MHSPNGLFASYRGSRCPSGCVTFQLDWPRWEWLVRTGSERSDWVIRGIRNILFVFRCFGYLLHYYFLFLFFISDSFCSHFFLYFLWKIYLYYFYIDIVNVISFCILYFFFSFLPLFIHISFSHTIVFLCFLPFFQEGWGDLLNHCDAPRVPALTSHCTIINTAIPLIWSHIHALPYVDVNNTSLLYY